MRVTIIATGIANTASVEAAFTRLGVEVEHTTDARRVEQARAVVLPGVGSFGAGMDVLRTLGLLEVLPERIVQGRATLAVCLGLQLLCRGSEESPEVEGLGVLDTVARRFPDSVSVPQFGWNRVCAGEGSRLIEDGHAYFANSYRIVSLTGHSAPVEGVGKPLAGARGSDWVCATTDHAGRFVSAIERGAVLGCQFHPEISGPWGQRLLGRWLAMADEGVGTC
ncbi:MAG: imidazole glycerol phosphate synthase subunit HisH [Phycisphaerales bacterium]|nr:imidazole glycerol phosphate synthase subunit HisH [Phycisphaerales bacterium]